MKTIIRYDQPNAIFTIEKDGIIKQSDVVTSSNPIPMLHEIVKRHLWNKNIIAIECTIITGEKFVDTTPGKN